MKCGDLKQNEWITLNRENSRNKQFINLLLIQSMFTINDKLSEIDVWGMTVVQEWTQRIDRVVCVFVDKCPLSTSHLFESKIIFIMQNIA